MSAGAVSKARAVTPAVTPTGSGETAKRGGGRDNVHPQAAKKHGAHSEPEIAPLREAHLVKLRKRFPLADEGVLFIQAERAAQLALIGTFLERKPGASSVIRNRRTTTIWPAREYAAKISSAYERTMERLEALAREHGDGERAPTLAQIEAEYAEDSKP